MMPVVVLQIKALSLATSLTNITILVKIPSHDHLAIVVQPRPKDIEVKVKIDVVLGGVLHPDHVVVVIQDPVLESEGTGTLALLLALDRFKEVVTPTKSIDQDHEVEAQLIDEIRIILKNHGKKNHKYPKFRSLKA